jgi:nitroreductase
MRFNISELNEIIRTRRTIFPEQFSERKVHKEIIEVLLENARWAPTHKLTQPWKFTVFMGDGIKKFADFHAETYKQFTPVEKFSEMKYETFKKRPLAASAVIAICMKRDERERLPEVEEIAAVACAVQNMYLTASAYGLAAYWGSGGMTYSDAMKNFLQLGEKDQCLGFLYIGYPAMEWPRSTPRKPIEYYTDWVNG